MGPMSIRIGSHFPFNITCQLKGHSFVAQELRGAGIASARPIMASWLPAMWQPCKRLRIA